MSQKFHKSGIHRRMLFLEIMNYGVRTGMRRMEISTTQSMWIQQRRWLNVNFQFVFEIKYSPTFPSPLRYKLNVWYWFFLLAHRWIPLFWKVEKSMRSQVCPHNIVKGKWVIEFLLDCYSPWFKCNSFKMRVHNLCHVPFRHFAKTIYKAERKIIRTVDKQGTLDVSKSFIKKRNPKFVANKTKSGSLSRLYRIVWIFFSQLLSRSTFVCGTQLKFIRLHFNVAHPYNSTPKMQLSTEFCSRGNNANDFFWYFIEFHLLFARAAGTLATKNGTVAT